MDTEKKEEVTAVEVVPVSAMQQIEKASIDCQIATAHAYPRSMQSFKRKAHEMVTMDEDTAQSCIYRRPVGKEKDGTIKFAEGKSIRMAEIVGACYGNLRVGSMLVDQTERWVKARGFAHDLESNFAATSEVVESTIDKFGNPYSERQRTVSAKSCLSKALRDATFRVVPGALCKSMEEAARQTAIGTTATIGARRTKIMDWINKLGIDAGRVWAALGVAGIEDVGLDQMETLTGIRTAIKEGDTTLDDAFPAIETKEVKSRAATMAEKAAKKPDAPTQAPVPAESVDEQRAAILAILEPLSNKAKFARVCAACKVDVDKWQEADLDALRLVAENITA